MGIGFLLFVAGLARQEAKWLTKYKDAQTASQKDWKPIVIYAGREAAGTCKAMESQVLPNEAVSKVLSDSFVCLKVDIDNPPSEVKKYLSQVKDTTLPFYVYVAPDGKFISGTSGYRDTNTFQSDLDGALKSDLVKLPPEVEKKLAKLAERAAKDLEAKMYQEFFKAAAKAQAVKGISESKAKINELLAQAVEAGMLAIQEAADLSKSGKFEEAMPILRRLLKDFKGSEVETAAQAANKALERLKNAAKSPAPQAKRLYELIVKECAAAKAFVEVAEEKLKE